ncbi:TetR/AcrR family transcriptional regulator [Amycolatopsis albispora]|uniref:TetR family transcriptional regulator n=1 Tax=Amycolatopsis albispora TaxID=1804986 RepID=A0A344LCY2_9PSEU|nr:TetR/AcrR family transcriptional regulator [Amycolatopsis albispora]AXB45906.1 TetR family transcriptional regulator [Amycolatopsis albispora]
MSGKRLTRGERRERILAAAAEVFAERGYDGAGMREVATRAGISTPVLYDHFPAKAQLYSGLLQSEVDSLQAAWGERPAPRDAEELFTTTVDAIFGWIERNERGWRMIFAESPADPEVAEVHRRAQARATEKLAELFAAVPLATDLDRTRANELFAETYKSAVNAIAGWWWHHRDLPRARVVALTTDLLWHGLRRLTEEAP